MARVLLIDHDETLGRGLQDAFAREGHEAELALGGATGLGLARAHRPDLVILELALPDADGYDVLAALRADAWDVPVMILSVRHAETDKVHGFRLGADDYVTKPFGLSELLARSAALVRRGAATRHTPSAAHRFGAIRVDPAARLVTRDGVPVPLRPRAFDLLERLVSRPSVVRSRADLLREVWREAADPDPRIVDHHVVELRRRLEPDPHRPRHLLTVWKSGYRFDP